MEIFVGEGLFGGGEYVFVDHDGDDVAVYEEALSPLLYFQGAEFSAVEQSSCGIEVVDHNV